MISYTKAAMERAMKVQEVILRALAKKISWWQAAEIIGISDRQLRRWRERYEEFGFRGLFDRRRGKPSPKRVPVATLERVLELANQPIAPWRVYQDQSGGITSGLPVNREQFITLGASFYQSGVLISRYPTRGLALSLKVPLER